MSKKKCVNEKKLLSNTTISEINNKVIELESSMLQLSFKNDSKDSYDEEQFCSTSASTDNISCNTEDACIQSTIPSDFEPEDHIFHINFIKNCVKNLPPLPKKFKNGTRKSLSFSNDKMRDIERSNRILLEKILTKGPTAHPSITKRKPAERNNSAPSRVSSAEVNRRKQQKQIDNDNELLRKKLQRISRRKSAI